MNLVVSVHILNKQILELVSFKERLAASHTRAVVAAEAEAAALASVAEACLAPGSPTPSEAMAPLGADKRGFGMRSDGQLRFNEDLALRPAWLPPALEEPRLAVAEWWELHARTSPQGKLKRVGFAQSCQGKGKCVRKSKKER
jgi:hypothetical protein